MYILKQKDSLTKWEYSVYLHDPTMPTIEIENRQQLYNYVLDCLIMY